jgi:transposase InsO family protein
MAFGSEEFKSPISRRSHRTKPRPQPEGMVANFLKREIIDECGGIKPRPQPEGIVAHFLKGETIDEYAST